MSASRLLSRASVPLAAILLLLAVAACSNPGRDVLDRASAVIDEHPDSAYAILAAVDPATLRNEADSALYALRWTQALYHTDREDSIVADSVLCDRLIPYAAAHYDMQCPSQEQTQAFYYAGIAEHLREHDGPAICHYLNAIESATGTDTPDTLMLARIHRDLSHSFNALMDYRSAIHHAREAFRLFERLGDISRAGYQRFETGRILYNAGRYADAIAALDTAMAHEGVPPDSPLHFACLRYQAYSWYLLENPDKALEVFGKMDSAGTADWWPDDFNFRGGAYLQTGQTAGAQRCRELVDSLGVGDRWLRSCQLRAAGDYAGAVALMDDIMTGQEAYIREIAGRQAIRYMSDSVLKSRIARKERQRRQLAGLWTIIGLGCAAAACLSFWLYRKLRHSRRYYSDSLADLGVSLGRSISELERHKAAMRNMRDEAERDHARLNEELDRVRSEAERDRAQLNEELDRTRTEAERDREQLNEELDRTRTEAERDREQLNEELDRTRTEAERDREQLERYRTELRDSREKIRSQQSEIDATRIGLTAGRADANRRLNAVRREAQDKARAAAADSRNVIDSQITSITVFCGMLDEIRGLVGTAENDAYQSIKAGNIQKRLTESIHDYFANPVTRRAVESAANALSGNLVAGFREECPKAGDIHALLLSFHILDFSTKEITAIMGVSKSTLSMRKRRVMDLLKGNTSATAAAVRGILDRTATPAV